MAVEVMAVEVTAAGVFTRRAVQAAEVMQRFTAEAGGCAAVRSVPLPPCMHRLAVNLRTVATLAADTVVVLPANMDGTTTSAVAGAVGAGVVAVGVTADMAGAGLDTMPGGVTRDTTTRITMVMDPTTGAAMDTPTAPTAIGGAAIIIAATMEAALTVGTWFTAPITID